MAGPLDLSAIEEQLGDASEFMRMWSRGGGAMCIIEPQNLGADPAMFGIAMADAIRHGAKAWANAVQVSEEHALERIMQGFNAEMKSPTDKPLDVDVKPN